jgi:hypothetical protein
MKRTSDPFSSTYKDNQYSPSPQTHHHQLHKKFAKVATAKQANKQASVREKELDIIKCTGTKKRPAGWMTHASEPSLGA